MGQSNRSAVDANKIDPEERLDLVVPRNGSLTLDVYLTNEDEDGVSTPADLTGVTLTPGVRTSYQSTAQAFAPTITARDDINGFFKITYPAARAKAIGIDVLDCVHDLTQTPSGGGEPTRVWAGLLELSKGAS